MGSTPLHPYLPTNLDFVSFLEPFQRAVPFAISFQGYTIDVSPPAEPHDANMVPCPMNETFAPAPGERWSDEAKHTVLSLRKKHADMTWREFTAVRSTAGAS